MAGFFSFLTPSKNKTASKTKATPRRVQAANVRSPASLPRWEAIRGPPSTPSTFYDQTPTPIRTKRTIDELQDASTSYSPSKKRAVTPAPVASSSRVRLDTLRAAAPAYKTPPASARGKLTSRPFGAARPDRVSFAESPSADRGKQTQVPLSGANQPGLIDLTQVMDSDSDDNDVPDIRQPSAKALGKRKANPAFEETEPSAGREQVDEVAEPVRVKKKRKQTTAPAESTTQGAVTGKQTRLAAEARPEVPSKSRPGRPPASDPAVKSALDAMKRKMGTRNRNKMRKLKDNSQAGERSVARQAPLPSPPPEPSDSDTETLLDSEEEAWLERTAQELDLDRDHVQVLRRIREEPDEKKFLYAVGWQMSREPWEIAPEIKRKLTALTTDLLLSFEWPTPFKNRQFNIYRFLESIKSNPSRIGLDRSWIKEPLKFYALQSNVLFHFSLARHYIKTKIEESVERRSTIEELAESLGKKDTNRNGLRMLALLRRVFRKHAPDNYFDRVDKALSRLQSKPSSAIQKLDEYLTQDRARFPGIAASETSADSSD